MNANPISAVKLPNNKKIPDRNTMENSNGSPNQLKVFVQRDYSDGSLVKFQTRFPSELEDRIDRQVFENTINQLNEHFAEAERTSCGTYCKGFFSCLTVYCFQLCYETKYEKCIKKASKFIAEQNEKLYEPKGLLITDPCARGLRVLEITSVGFFLYIGTFFQFFKLRFCVFSTFFMTH